MAFNLKLGAIFALTAVHSTVFGVIPVCFRSGDCYDLTTYKSTKEDRAQLLLTCKDPGSPFGQVGCENYKIGGKWTWEADTENLGYHVQNITNMTSQYAEDMQALQLQQHLHGSALPTMLGVNGKGLVNDSWKIPLLLSSSASNRLRDLPDKDKEKLWYKPFNYPPQPANQDSNFPNSTILYHGATWFQPFCNLTHQTVPFFHVNTGSTSTSIRSSHAMSYAGTDGTMWVWLSDTNGNQPFTGEWEFDVMPGATFKQIGCDVFAPPSLPWTTKMGNVRTVSFSYETSSLAELSPEAEALLLKRLRSSFYDDAANQQQMTGFEKQ